MSQTVGELDQRVFDRITGYGYIHHRALNGTNARDQTFDIVGRHPDVSHILEGDVCWDFTGSNEQIYFRHPSFVIDTLNHNKVRELVSADAMVDLDVLERIAGTNASVIFELKVGRGDWRRAIQTLLERAEAIIPGRYWIDGFSPIMLAYIKSIRPQTPTTLHTECVMNGRVLIGAPEWPPIGIRRIADLDFADGIAIRRRGSANYMARACQQVHAAGKQLILSRLHTLEHFRLSKTWSAKAGYMHWDFDDLVKYDEQLESSADPVGSV